MRDGRGDGQRMKKVIVIGCPGSGKSSFSRVLHQQTGIPLCHLDMLYWNADKTTVPKPVFLERLSSVLAEDAWIIDGNYASTMELRMAACDTVIFLDYPLEVCLDGAISRIGKKRSDMPWIENALDPQLKSQIESFGSRHLPAIHALIDRYRDGRTVVILKSREEADSFLRCMEQSGSKFD